MSLECGPAAGRAGWTEDRVERLIGLWREGRTAAEVAAALGGVTRNAVIGKVFRLGLCRGRAARPKPRAAAAPRRVRPARARAPRAAPGVPGGSGRAPSPFVELAPLAPFLERLGARACRWPIGDPRAEGFGFCGRAAAAGPYCEAHRRVAYETTSDGGEMRGARRAG